MVATSCDGEVAGPAKAGHYQCENSLLPAKAGPYQMRKFTRIPDGLLYVLTDEEPAALLKIEPVAATPNSL